MDKNLLKFVDLELKLQLFAATKLFFGRKEIFIKTSRPTYSKNIPNNITSHVRITCQERYKKNHNPIHA